MKRLHIINKPTKLVDLADIDIQDFEDRLPLESEKRQAKRLRRFRHLLAV